jgi:phosphatidylglycerol lysyltransferase
MPRGADVRHVSDALLWSTSVTRSLHPHHDRPAARRRALEILRGHGWITVSFQLLESEFRYWFDGEDAFVAYVDTGSAWVVGGGPVAPEDRLREVALRFTEAARAAGRRACFFGCERRFVAAAHMRTLRIGEQPVWTASEWDDVLAANASLRYQLRRAQRKGVTVRAATADELSRTDAPVRHGILQLGAQWLAARRMAPMGFLVQLEPLTFAKERVVLVAECQGELVAFLSAVPVYARRRLFIEDLIRGRRAPNGTIELLIDAAMRAAVARGDETVTLGLAPLAGAVSRPLRLARAVSTPLYDFRGLRAFKAKLSPSRWEGVYVVSPGSPWLALRDALRAFAGGSLLRFGVRTLAQRIGVVTPHAPGALDPERGASLG